MNMKSEVKISEVVGHFLPLKQIGDKKFMGLCPFHPDTSPHLVIDDFGDSFHCKLCESKGGSLDFLMKYKAVAPEEAQKILMEISGEIYEIYSSTRTGDMKIREGATIDQLSSEASELCDFISSIENAPEWRDVSITELIERTRAVIEAFGKVPIGAKQDIYRQLLLNFLRLTRVSYLHEFGHQPYCDLNTDESFRWLEFNHKRFRGEKNSIVHFVANIFHRIGKYLGIG